MSLFWHTLASAGLLLATTPAMAQRTELPRAPDDRPYDNETEAELRRVSPTVAMRCKADTRGLFEQVQMAQERFAHHRNVVTQISQENLASLKLREEDLQRRIALARSRGEEPRHIGPDQMGDLMYQLELVRTEQRSRAAGKPRGAGISPDSDNRDFWRRQYSDSLLSCLDFRDRYPGREWCDPNPSPFVPSCNGDPRLTVRNPEEEGRRVPPPWVRGTPGPVGTTRNTMGQGYGNQPLPLPRAEGAIDTTGWDGVYQDANSRYNVAGSPSGGIGVNYTAIKPGLKQEGAVTCRIVSGRAECTGGGSYSDDDKSVEYKESWSVTLSGRTISGTYVIDDVSINWRVPEYSTFFTKGRTGTVSLEKVGR